MVVVQATKLNNVFSNDCSSSSTSTSTSTASFTSSIMLEPKSSSLALIHSDSSISLYPPSSISSPFSPTSNTATTNHRHHHHHHHQTLKIPQPTSSSTFLQCQSSSTQKTQTLFIVSSPHLSKSILLRFYIFSQQASSHIICNNVLCNHKAFTFLPNLGLLLNAPHGLSVKLYAASANVFALYSLSVSNIWLFAAKIVHGDDGGVAVRLIKTAEIQCSVPVWSVSLSYGYFILGEDSGVRIFALRPLVKGRARRNDSKNHAVAAQGALVERKIDAHQSSEKLRPVRVKADSSALFVAFKRREVAHDKATSPLQHSAKAITIQALSPNKFLILDSLGDLHLLHLSSPLLGLNLTSDMWPLTQTMKVQKLAVLHDVSLRAQTVWLTDGFYSVHKMDISDVDSHHTSKNDKPDSVESRMQLSVNQAIFTREKIQDIAPLSANAVLILGQGGVFAYEFS